MKKLIYSIFTIALLGVMVSSCGEDSLEPTLAQSKAVETGIINLEDLQGVLAGAYNRMTQTAYYGRDVIIYGEVRSDNCWCNSNSGRFTNPAAMTLGANEAYPTDTWAQIYRVVASANAVISKEGANLEGDADMINHTIGEAYAMRALAHFDLLKLYGQQHVTGGDATLGIPYIRKFKDPNDISPSRNTVAEVRTYIYEDLNKALTLMDETLNDDSKQFITTYAVYAMLARVGTYFGDWPTVRDACEPIISSGAFSIVPQADFVASWYTDAAVNSIFELAFSTVDNMNINGLSQIYRGAAYGDVRVLPALQTIFDAGDVRNSAAMIANDPAAPTYLTNMGKYPSANYSDNISLFRFEEIILEYAEALFNLSATGITYQAGNTALHYLNLVPAARGAAAYGAVSEANILQERRREFCFEGFRFDDLARTGSDIPEVDAILQTHGGPTYGSYNYAFPIPRAELISNGNMVQNFGYTE